MRAYQNRPWEYWRPLGIYIRDLQQTSPVEITPVQRKTGTEDAVYAWRNQHTEAHDTISSTEYNKSESTTASNIIGVTSYNNGEFRELQNEACLILVYSNVQQVDHLKLIYWDIMWKSTLTSPARTAYIRWETKGGTWAFIFTPDLSMKIIFKLLGQTNVSLTSEMCLQSSSFSRQVILSNAKFKTWGRRKVTHWLYPTSNSMKLEITGVTSILSRWESVLGRTEILERECTSRQIRLSSALERCWLSKNNPLVTLSTWKDYDEKNVRGDYRRTVPLRRRGMR